ncbi:MAG TPA: universal stress protein [Microlunatus sp.]
MVGVDQSAPSRAALQWAARYARRTGSKLEAIFVPQQRRVTMPYAVGVSGIPLSDPVAWEEGAWAAVSDLFAAIDPEPTWILRQVGHRSPGAELVDASRHAALLVIGTREHTGVDRLLLGSVSHYCLSHARIPVVAVQAADAVPDVRPPSADEMDNELHTTIQRPGDSSHAVPDQFLAKGVT